MDIIISVVFAVLVFLAWKDSTIVVRQGYRAAWISLALAVVGVGYAEAWLVLVRSRDLDPAVNSGAGRAFAALALAYCFLCVHRVLSNGPKNH